MLTVVPSEIWAQLLPMYKLTQLHDRYQGTGTAEPHEAPVQAGKQRQLN